MPIRRLIIAILLFLLIACIGLGARFLPDLSWIVDREASIRYQIALKPLSSWTFGLIVYVALSLVPATSGKSIVFGWLFGFLAALVLVEIGLTAAALLSFILGRYVIKQMFHDRWQSRIRLISERFEKNGAFYLIWLRLAHAPFTLINYGAGATRVPLTTFWWTTHLGILPATAVYTFVGSRIPDLRTVVERGVWAIIDPPFIIVLAVVACLPFLVSPWAKRLRKHFGEDRSR